MNLSAGLQALGCLFEAYEHLGGKFLGPELCREMAENLQNYSEQADRLEAQVFPQSSENSEAENVVRLDPWRRRNGPPVPPGSGDGGDAA